MPNENNPAEEAAQRALDNIYACIADNKSFVLEAGAGSGKTYSLIKTLNHLIEIRGSSLLRLHQKIACITFTNVAKDQINSRTDKNPLIHPDTIHAFCWSLIKSFQVNLREELVLIPKWQQRIEEKGIAVTKQTISYDLGYPSISEESITLYHDDVLALTVALLDKPKFRSIFIDKYPILLIDEYQDTHKDFADALQRYFLNGEPQDILIGFFGDHWQKIYGEGCGKIDNTFLEPIDKNSNFRSVSTIVSSLNRMRPELPQYPQDDQSEGSVGIYQTNNWGGVRRTEPQWKGDLPSDIAHNYLNSLKVQLGIEGWDLSPDKTKILMLTHNVLADEQGYRNLADIFERNEYIKKEDKHIAFFVDILEPFCVAYENKKYGEMLNVLGGKKGLIHSHENKAEIVIIIEGLIQLRNTATVGEVIDYLLQKKYPRLPESLERKDKEFREYVPDIDVPEPDAITRLKKMRALSYKEIISFAQFSNEHTPFATKHSVKGAEFENVLVVIGRGWNQYNFDQMLAWSAVGIPSGKTDTYERSRNLFYVCCSRPKKRLAILFTQEVSPDAIATLGEWFEPSNIHAL